MEPAPKLVLEQEHGQEQEAQGLVLEQEQEQELQGLVQEQEHGQEQEVSGAGTRVGPRTRTRARSARADAGTRAGTRTRTRLLLNKRSKVCFSMYRILTFLSVKVRTEPLIVRLTVDKLL
jgi:hypothetical protein